MYKWGYALEKLQFTNLDLQICNCKVAMLACSGYKVPTLHLQNTKLHSSKFGLQVWNDITHMYIYGATNHKYWFTNLQLHGCNVRILTPLAFHMLVTWNIYCLSSICLGKGRCTNIIFILVQTTSTWLRLRNSAIQNETSFTIYIALLVKNLNS